MSLQRWLVSLPENGTARYRGVSVTRLRGGDYLLIRGSFRQRCAIRAAAWWLERRQHDLRMRTALRRARRNIRLELTA